MIVEGEEAKLVPIERRAAAASSDKRRRAAMEEEALSEGQISEHDVLIIKEDEDKSRRKRSSGKSAEGTGASSKGGRAKPKTRKCSMCKKVARTFVTCQSCNKNYHFECANLKDRKQKPKSYTCNA
eukprot:TRINITY_DN23647_c0_g1_i1.p1 TRINITY_DN23647_c0_g1~~TRINITY_DN23647_c0_g1_i1.p1  ORF type:complete len:126 (-),score=19.83 TRINITY_DN23647_c0_g1_i1:3-380(-)